MERDRVHSGGWAGARRGLVFLLFSFVLHLGAALALVIGGPAMWIPKVDVTWLDMDNRLGSPQLATPERKPAPPRIEPRKALPKPRVQRAKPRPTGDELALSTTTRDAGPPPTDAGAPRDGAAPSFTAEKVAIADLAPGDAALILLLRMDRIRGSPYELSVRRLLEVFYDHKTILWGSGLDPVNDFEALLIATPNPYRVTETFLAVRSAKGASALRRGFERAASFGKKKLRWVARGTAARGEIPSPPKLAHDPRVIWLQGEVALLTDPKQVAALTAPGPAADAGTPAPSWLARLGLMGDRGGPGAGAPGMLLQAVNLPRLVALPADLPTPLGAQLSVEAADPSRADGLITFASETAARSFLAETKRRIERVRQSDDRVSRILRWMGVADLLASIRFQQKQATVSASLQLREKEVKALLELARGLIPQVQVPGMPERRPPDARVARPPDAGPPRRDARSVH